MPIFKNKDIETKEVFPGILIKKGIDRENGSGAVTLGMMTIQEGHEIPRHLHNVEDSMFIISGEGQVEIGDDVYSLEEGDQVLIPAGTPHMLKNIGKEPLKLVFVYPSVNVSRILL